MTAAEPGPGRRADGAAGDGEARSGPRHRASGRHRLPRSPTTLLALGVVLVVLVAVAVGALVRAGGSAPAASTGAGAPASGAGAELARWARAELPPGDRLVAAPGAAAALRRAGVPAGVVTPGGSAATAPGTALAVTDGTVPAGSRLVARFGEPAALAVVDPAPVQPTTDELRRRRDLAAALLANPTDRVAVPAAAVLRAAAVDPRLLSVLAALTARSGIGLAALPARGDEPADVPLARSALIATVGGRPVSGGSPDVPALVAFLRAQLPPYAPDEVTVTATGVVVGYRYLSGPDAAVTAASY